MLFSLSATSFIEHVQLVTKMHHAFPDVDVRRLDTDATIDTDRGIQGSVQPAIRSISTHTALSRVTEHLAIVVTIIIAVDGRPKD